MCMGTIAKWLCLDDANAEIAWHLAPRPAIEFRRLFIGSHKIAQFFNGDIFLRVFLYV